MEIRHVRNATTLIALGPHRLVVDPMLAPAGAMPGFELVGGGRRPNPLVPLPPGASEWLESATGVLVTHEHPDHLDRAALEWIRARRLPVWASPIDAPSLARKGLDVRELGPGALGAALEIVPAQHGRGWLGWLMGPVSGVYLARPGEPSLYLTSDAVLTASVRDALGRLRPDVVVAPAGAANMGLGGDILFSVDELVELVRLAPGRVVLNHLEALDHCPTTRAGLIARMEREGLGAKVWVPEDGEAATFEAPAGATPILVEEGAVRGPGLQKWVTSWLTAR